MSSLPMRQTVSLPVCNEVSLLQECPAQRILAVISRRADRKVRLAPVVTWEANVMAGSAIRKHNVHSQVGGFARGKAKCESWIEAYELFFSSAVDQIKVGTRLIILYTSPKAYPRLSHIDCGSHSCDTVESIATISPMEPTGMATVPWQVFVATKLTKLAASGRVLLPLTGNCASLAVNRA